MNDLLQECDAPVVDLLRQTADKVQPEGFRRWRFKLGDELAQSACARLEEDWLLIEASPAGGGRPTRLTAQRLRGLLQWNGVLPGGVKFALADDPPGVLLLAEIPLDDEQRGLQTRFAEACTGFRQGAMLFAGKGPPEISDHHESPGQDANAPLTEICEETGWPFTQRADGCVAIQLDVAGAFHQTLAEQRADGRLRLSVNLDSPQPIASTSQLAVDVLLLTACRVVRLARATVAPVNDRTAYCWETTLGDAPNAFELEQALASLSVACRVSAREIRILEDESIAQKHLAVRGWSSLLPGACSSRDERRVNR